ncbi:MAG: hypothetical protein ACJ764_11080 [Solirubrobacteraceae bacterium]
MAAVGSLMLTACGGGAPVPQVVGPAAPDGFHVLRYPAYGLTLMSPRSWSTVPATAPQVALVTSGGAVISLWRYRRSGPSPNTLSELQSALRRLISSARARQPTLRLIASRVESVDGRPALELETIQRIGQAIRQVTSTHVFSPAGEIVLEEYAPQPVFPGLERTVFAPVRRSLTVSAR